MPSYCARCGREASLQAGADGSMLCQDCLVQSRPQNMDCRSCADRYCGGVLACAFCSGCIGAESAEKFTESVKRPVLEPIRMDERCQRCGSTLAGRAFILRGKALCRACLIYEQDRWEIVTAKPGKGGSRVKIIIEKPAAPDEAVAARKLLHTLGIDPDNPPPDPFSGKKPLREAKMPDGACVNCEAYALEKKRATYPGNGKGGEEKD